MNKIRNALALFLCCYSLYGCFNNDIEFVKNQTLEDKTATIGGMTSGYPFLTDQKWSNTKDAQGRSIITFSGKINDGSIASLKKDFETTKTRMDDLVKTYKNAPISALSADNKQKLEVLGVEILKLESDMSALEKILSSKTVNLLINFAINADKSGVAVKSVIIEYFDKDNSPITKELPNGNKLIEAIQKNEDPANPIAKAFFNFQAGSLAPLTKKTNEPSNSDIADLAKDIWTKYVNDNPGDVSYESKFTLQSTNSWKSESAGETFFNVEFESRGTSGKYRFTIAVVERGTKWYAKFTQIPQKIY